MATSPNFWNWIAKLYAKQPIADEAAYKHKLEVTRKLLRPDMNVLEFGCGTGSTALLHAPYVESIVAIDFSNKMIEIATDKANEQGVDNVSFQKCRIEDWSADGHSFDVIFGLGILQHQTEILGSCLPNRSGNAIQAMRSFRSVFEGGLYSYPDIHGRSPHKEPTLAHQNPQVLPTPTRIPRMRSRPEIESTVTLGNIRNSTTNIR